MESTKVELLPVSFSEFIFKHTLPVVTALLVLVVATGVLVQRRRDREVRGRKHITDEVIDDLLQPLLQENN